MWVDFGLFIVPCMKSFVSHKDTKETKTCRLTPLRLCERIFLAKAQRNTKASLYFWFPSRFICSSPKLARCIIIQDVSVCSITM